MGRTYPFDTMPTIPPAPGVRRQRSVVLPVLAVVLGILLTANIGTLLAWTSTSGRLDTTRHDLLARENTLGSVREALESTKQELSERSASLREALGTIDHAKTCINGMAKSLLQLVRSPLIGVLTLKDDLDRIHPDCRAVIHGGGGGGSSLF